MAIRLLGTAGGGRNEKIYFQDGSKDFLVLQRLLTRTTITGEKGSRGVPPASDCSEFNVRAA